MSKPVTEVESPILSSFVEEDEARWEDAARNPWACKSVLEQFFRLGLARQIVFVSKARTDGSTYQVQISPSGIWLQKPEEHVLYDALSVWLRTQIAAGRPHIGVRIVK